MSVRSTSTRDAWTKPTASRSPAKPRGDSAARDQRLAGRADDIGVGMLTSHVKQYSARPEVLRTQPPPAASKHDQEPACAGQNSTKRASGIERLKALSQKVGTTNGDAARRHAHENTAGFESPEKQRVIDQLTKEEVRLYVQRSRTSAPGQCAVQPVEWHGSSRRSSDDRGYNVDQEDARAAEERRSMNGMRTSAAGTGVAAVVALHKDARLEMMVTRDVAARIIQAHWRQWRDWKRQLRRDAEERVLQQVLGPSSNMHTSLARERRTSATHKTEAGSTHSAGGARPADVRNSKQHAAAAPPVASKARKPASAPAERAGSKPRQAPRYPSPPASRSGSNRERVPPRMDQAVEPMSDFRAPRAYAGPARADLAELGIQRTHSIPGGHSVYTVSAATSRRASTAGDEGSLADERMEAWAARPAAEEPATAAPAMQEHKMQQYVAYEDEGQDEHVEEEEEEGHGPHEQPSREQEHAEVEGGAPQLLRKLAAGVVPTSMREDELQMLLEAITKAKLGDRGASGAHESHVAAAGGEGLEEGVGDSDEVTGHEGQRIQADVDAYSASGASAARASRSYHGNHEARERLEHEHSFGHAGAPELAAEASISLGSTPSAVQPRQPAAATEHGQPPRLSSGSTTNAREESLQRLRRLSMGRSSHQGGRVSNDEQTAGAPARAAQQAPPLAAQPSQPAAGSRPGTAYSYAAPGQDEEENLDLIHELRASQALVDGSVHVHAFQSVAADAHPGAVHTGVQHSRAGMHVLTSASKRYASAPGGAAGLSPPQSPTMSGHEGWGTKDAAARRQTAPAAGPQTSTTQQSREEHRHSAAPAIPASSTAAMQPRAQATGYQWPRASVAASAAAPVQQPPAGSPSSSMTAEKLSSILRFLDDVEQKSASDVVAAPALAPATAPTPASHVHRAWDAPAAPPAPVHAATPAAVWHGAPAGASPAPSSSAASPGASPAISITTAAARRVSAGEALLARIGLADTGGDDGAAVHQFGRPSASAGAGRPTTSAGSGGSVGSLAAMMHAAEGGMGVTSKPAHLAESVYDGVRTKIRRLQEELRNKDSTISTLHKELDGAARRTSVMLAEVEGRGADALAAARAEHEAALARHLSFMDRLLADKDELTRKVAAQAEALRAVEERQERALAKMKDGFAAELKRQKEGWAASERVRREQWQEAKTQEVKELTVKGLETEVQKLLARHKAELAAVQAAAAEEARRALDVAAAQHELAMRGLKERMAKEGEEAAERERGAAATRLREACERYEQQLAMQRMRLVSDGDLRLEQLEAARREERKRHEEAIARAAAEAEERVRGMEEEARKEREALRRAHERALDEARVAGDAEAEGWRAAVAERARRDLAEREAALRERMVRERDEQIEAIVSRLEAENAAARDAARSDAAQREAGLVAKHAAALKEAKKGEARWHEQLRLAGAAASEAEARAAAAEQAAEGVRRESEARASTIRWLESQLAAVQERATAAERAMQNAASGRDNAVTQAVQAVAREREGVEARLRAALKEVDDLRTQHAQEMGHVEARVKAALARKDEALSSAQTQAAQLAAQLRTTEAVLAAQQAELRLM